MWNSHVSLESKRTPRNLKVVSEGTGVAERKKVGVVTIISLEKARAPHLPTEKKKAPLGRPGCYFV